MHNMHMVSTAICNCNTSYCECVLC